MYLVIDTETGGVDPQKHSLLTAYFALYSDDLNFINDLEVTPSSDEYVISPKALEINNINLVEHSKGAEPSASMRLGNFLSFATYTYGTRPIPVGHNVEFDLQFVYNNLLSKRDWEHYVSYRKLDTSSVIQFLQLTGHLSSNLRGSLQETAKHLDVTGGEAHNARGDVETTVNVLKALRDVVKEEK